MVLTLSGLIVGLETVAYNMKLPRNSLAANMNSFSDQFIGQTPGTLACPSQRRFWFAASERLNRCFKPIGKSRPTMNT
jgi:hypothetical protein